MLNRIGSTWMVIVGVGVAVMGTQSTKAAYVKYGQGMQVRASGTTSNGGLDIQTVNTWINLTPPAKPYTMDANFAIPMCDDVVLSRLVLTIWGGTASYTCQVHVAMNGTAIADIASLGGDGLNGSSVDANPSFTPYDTNTTNVYGTGSGVWLVSVPVGASILHKDGATNRVSVTISDPSGNFDGRIVQATLVSVYQATSLKNTFDYAIAEGSGDIYRGTAGAVSSRIVDMGPATPSGITSAWVHALYTYGDYAQNDRLYFDGVQIGSDNVANHQNNYTALDYVPDLASFNVTSGVQATNTVRFSVSAADGIPGTLESSLRPSLAALAVTRVPYYTLNLQIVNSGMGNVTVSPNEPNYPSGTVVTLSATPISGKSFREWTIWADPNQYPDANYAVVDSNAVLQLTMDHDYTVEAAFKCGSGMGLMLPMLTLGAMALVRRKG